MKRYILGVLVVLVAAFAVTLMARPATAWAEEGEKPPVSCAEQCRLRSERVLKACMQGGGGAEPCRQRADAQKRACLAACPRAAEPSPGPVEPAPRACEVRCETYGKTVFEACMLLPIGPSEEQCQRRQEQAVRICMQKTCAPKERPDPEVCKGRCETAARELYRKCIGGSTGATPEACGQRARQWLQNCIEKNCKPASVEPRPEPGACRTQCHERVRTWHAECMARPDAAPERCRAQAERKLAACLGQCP